MNSLSAGTLLRCFLRSYFGAACYNPRGLQNIGFTYAIEPALAALYGPGEALRSARLRYVQRFNTHPFWMPLLLGIFLRLEAEIAGKQAQPALLESLKDTTANSLSAIGDSFFQGSAAVCWVLISGCLAVSGQPVAVALLALVLFLAAQALRLVCFIAGFRKGMACLIYIRRLQLIDWAVRIKFVNAGLLALLFLLSARESGSGLWLLAVPVFLALSGGLMWRLHVPRFVLPLGAALCVVFVVWAGML